jgi:CBS domain-containing protein
MKDTSITERMSKDVITVGWSTPIQEAADIMEDNQIRHVGVTDDSGMIVGILSDRDIKRAMDPKTSVIAANSEVNEYMSWPVITVPHTMSIQEVAQGMIDEKISAFLVAENDEIVGIITTEDLLKVLVNLLSPPDKIKKFSYSPVVGELLREAQASGI